MRHAKDTVKTAKRPEPATLWGFDLSRAVSRGFSNEELESLCSPFAGGRDISLKRRPYVQSDWKVEHYSFGRLYRRWLNLPWWLPLGFSGEHGFERRPEILPHERNSPFRTFVTFCDERVEFNRGSREKEFILAPHPWVTYRRSVGYQISRQAAGSLIFIPHESDVARHEPFNYATHFNQINEEPTFPPPRAICLSGNDIRFRKRHLEFRHYGIPIVTAGDPASPYFVDRFYTLVALFRACASCNPGSEMLYTTEMGHDFWCTDTTKTWPILRTSRTDYYTDGYVVPEPNSRDDLIQQETVRIFGNRDSLHEEKLEFVGKFLGLNADCEGLRTAIRRRSLRGLLKRPDALMVAYARTAYAGLTSLMKCCKCRAKGTLKLPNEA